MTLARRLTALILGVSGTATIFCETVTQSVQVDSREKNIFTFGEIRPMEMLSVHSGICDTY